MSISSYEQKIINILKDESVDFCREKTFLDLKSRYGESLRFDFYVETDEPFLVEIDGEAHFQEAFGTGRRGLMKQQAYDEKKNSYCLAKNIPLFRIPYTDMDEISCLQDIVQEKYRVRSKYHNLYLK